MTRDSEYIQNEEKFIKSLQRERVLVVKKIRAINQLLTLVTKDEEAPSKQ